jgi:excinuclease UvrABC ATPase subunit
VKIGKRFVKICKIRENLQEFREIGKSFVKIGKSLAKISGVIVTLYLAV